MYTQNLVKHAMSMTMFWVTTQLGSLWILQNILLPVVSGQVTYTESVGYCADLCCDSPETQKAAMPDCTQTMDWWSSGPDGVEDTYDAYAAWCTANDDCLGFGHHYTFDRVYLKSKLETNSDIAQCEEGVGLSAGNNEPINKCFVKNVPTCDAAEMHKVNWFDFVCFLSIISLSEFPAL